MPAYRVEIAPAAYRQLSKLPKQDLKRVRVKIDKLESNPRPSDCTKLKDSQNVYRIRAGDYRILYQIKDEILLVLVVKVAHRREAYKENNK